MDAPISSFVSIDWGHIYSVTDGTPVEERRERSKSQLSVIIMVLQECDAKNHLCGTFTAAKDRVVEAGRKLTAAISIACVQPAVAVGDLEESAPSRKRRKKRRKNGRTRRGHSGGMLSLLMMMLRM